MSIVYHPEVEQGSEAWAAMRCGRITMSELKLIMNPPPKVETRIKKNGEPYKQREQTPAENDAMRMHLFELLAQRITQHVEPQYIGDAMLRGWEDEITSRDIYSKQIAPVTQVGFITNDNYGFTLGYSPDGITGEDGQIECKSRMQKFQVQTIANIEVPTDFVLQIQGGLLVSERKYCDFISYSAGLPMMILRVYPDPKIQEAIIEAAFAFEKRLNEMHATYILSLKDSAATFIETKRPEVIDDNQNLFVDDEGNYK